MIENKTTIYCPTCGEKSIFLTDWEYSGLNESIFNYVAHFYECPICGLVFNANITDEKLSIFYANECTYFEKSHFDILAPDNIKKYSYYKSLIDKTNLSNYPITDIGCGRGGFLIWLQHNNSNEGSCGVDIDLKSIPEFSSNNNQFKNFPTFKIGKAVDLPFENNSQSVLTYFHVLEHIVDINKVLEEAERVLMQSGIIMIEVPDAEKYKDYPIGTGFWLSIREHIFHFSPAAINNALSRHGFEVCSTYRTLLPTPEFEYPSLIIVARKTKSKLKIIESKSRNIASFVTHSKNELNNQAFRINQISSKSQLLTLWGCSSEFFSLFPKLTLTQFSICDSSESKQKCHYNGVQVYNPKDVKKNGKLIIVPYLFKDLIKIDAIKAGWAEEDIYCLS